MKTFPEPIIVTQVFETSMSRVWNAVTLLEEMKEWYFPHLEAFEAALGFKTVFVLQVEDRVFTHQWKVTEVVHQKSITYEWTFKEYPGKGVSTFELAEHNGNTQLKLTSTTLENFPKHVPEFERESGVKGWNYLIKESLTDYLLKH